MKLNQNKINISMLGTSKLLKTKDKEKIFKVATDNILPIGEKQWNDNELLTKNHEG